MKLSHAIGKFPQPQSWLSQPPCTKESQEERSPTSFQRDIMQVLKRRHQRKTWQGLLGSAVDVSLSS